MPTVQVNRRRFLAGVGATAAPFLLGACGGDRGGGSPPLGDLTLQLNWIRDITFGGDYLMVERRLAQAAGFGRVELLVGGSSVAVEPIVASGRARFGYSAPDLLAAARAQGAPLVIIGVGYQRNPFSVLSRGERPLREPGDLKGRTVAVDDVNRVTFGAFLAANGIDDRLVTVVPANFDPSLLRSGQVDGYLGFVANEAVSLALEGVDVVRMDFDDHRLAGMGQAYVTTTDRVRNEPEVVTAALTAFVGGWRAFLADVPAGIEVSRRSFDPDAPADPRYLERSAAIYAENFLTTDTRTSGLLSVTEERQAAVVSALGLGGVATTAGELFDMTLLNRLYRDRPDLRAAP